MAQEKQGSLREIFTRDFLLISTINLAAFFGWQMCNIGMPMYVSQLGADAQVVGLVTTLVTVAATVMRLFAGPLLDRFGRKGAMVGGFIVIVCAIVSYAVFPVVGVVLGVRLLHGMGWGLGSTATSTTAADIVPKKRFAEGMGYFATTNSIASAFAPAVSIELVQGPGAIYMLAVAVGCTVLALVLAIVQFSSGEKVSLEREGADEEPAEVPGSDGGKLQPAGSGFTWETIIEKRAIVPGLLMLLVNVGFGAIITFLALHGTSQGVASVSVYFVVYAVVTLVSRPLIGRLIDRYGYRMPAILASLCSAGTLAFIGASSNTLMFALSGVLAGLGIGTSMGTFQAMAVAAVEPWRRGVATSTYYTLFDLGIAIGSLVSGMLAAQFGYSGMYYLVALCPVVAGILSAIFVSGGKQR